jgi:lysozyme family protein
MNRDSIIAFVIGLEGGYVDNPADPGGATNFGITQKFLDMARSANVTMGLPASVADLTQAQAASLYRTVQWAAVQGDSLPSPLALLAFDTAVNEGQARAALILQQALGVTPDGVIGPQTLAVATSAGPKVSAEFAARRAVCYAQLDAAEGQFELGWMRRLIAVYTEAIS